MERDVYMIFTSSPHSSITNLRVKCSTFSSAFQPWCDLQSMLTYRCGWDAEYSADNGTGALRFNQQMSDNLREKDLVPPSLCSKKQDVAAPNDIWYLQAEALILFPLAANVTSFYLLLHLADSITIVWCFLSLCRR